MNRSTKSIALVLIGTAVALGGCGREEDEEWSGASQESGTGGRSRSSGGVIFVPGPRIGGGGFSSGTSGIGGSARGGFGAVGGGSASS